MSKSTGPLAYASRHWKAFIAVGLVLGGAVVGGYKAIAVDDAKAAQAVVVIPAPASPPAPLSTADVAGLRQDIGDLRTDIREERKERSELSPPLRPRSAPQ